MSIDQRYLAIILLFASIATLYAIRAQHAHCLPDVYALAFALIAPRQGYALAAVVLFAILRHTPLAMGLAGGMPEWALWLLLPGAMSRWEDAEEETSGDPVHVPVPSITDTNADSPPDRDITRGAWLRAMAMARDEKGRYVFSANQIVKAIGGHRATILARVSEVRAHLPPPQFRQPDSTTAPATHPVSQR